MARQSKRASPRGLIFGFVVVLLSLGLSNLSSNLAGFNDHLDKFSFYVRDSDKQAADQELTNLKSYYDYFASLKLGYFSDKFLFPDMFLYEASISKMDEDWDNVELSLKNRQEDYRAVYLLNIAKFRALKEAYNSPAANKDPKLKAQILQMVLDQVRPGFEKCVKEGPGPEENYDCSFDYDLTSNADFAQKALESKIPGPQFALGDSRDGNDPGTDSGKKDGLDKRLDDPNPGSNPPTKKGG